MRRASCFRRARNWQPWRSAWRLEQRNFPQLVRCIMGQGVRGLPSGWGFQHRRQEALLTGVATDAPTIQELRGAGCESLRAIAAGLKERSIPAARGASGLLFGWRDCWRRLPSLSAEASPPRERQSGHAGASCEKSEIGARHLLVGTVARPSGRLSRRNDPLNPPSSPSTASLSGVARCWHSNAYFSLFSSLFFFDPPNRFVQIPRDLS